MTKMEFSKEQKDAIETMGKNIIVSAAAGSCNEDYPPPYRR